MQPGKILILNGTSSSGKSSILEALQTTLDDPYRNAGLDKFIWMLPACPVSLLMIPITSK